MKNTKCVLLRYTNVALLLLLSQGDDSGLGTCLDVESERTYTEFS